MQKTDQKIIYKTDRKLNSIFLGLLGVSWLVAIISGLSNGASITDPRIALGIFVWLILTIEMVFGFYGELNKTQKIFYRINYLGLKRKGLRFDEIREIRFQPVFIFSSSNRSLFIVGIHNGKQVNLYYFSDLNFSRHTLAQMAHDLKEVAPQIKYDAPAEALIKKYFP